MNTLDAIQGENKKQARKSRREYHRAYYYKNIDARRAYSREYAKRKRRQYKPGELRERNLKAKFNLTSEQYELLLSTQSGVCGICEEKCSVRSFLSVDHDHATGRIRGLLCSACNMALGGFKDSRDLLNKAILWLER